MRDAPADKARVAVVRDAFRARLAPPVMPGLSRAPGSDLPDPGSDLPDPGSFAGHPRISGMVTWTTADRTVVVAGQREITDPADPGIRPGDHALGRMITDTRTTLVLDIPGPGYDQSHGID
jgi:hypothetical protein